MTDITTGVHSNHPRIRARRKWGIARLFPIFLLSNCACTAEEPFWTGSWYASSMELAPPIDNVTLRSVVHLTSGGDRLRLRISNAYGRDALTIGAACASAHGVSKDVAFNGHSQVVVPPGKGIVSDPVELQTSAGADLSVAIFYPKVVSQITTHPFGGQETEITPGNTVHGPAPSAARVMLSDVYFLTGVDVEGANSRGAIVVVGDSLTTSGCPGCWPSLLAQHLEQQGKPYAVLNASVGGNRILRDSSLAQYGGASALSRFDRDALDQPGVRYAILFEGINDIAVGPLDGFGPPHPASSADLTAAIADLARRAHARGVKLYAATLPPFEGTAAPGYYSTEKNLMRQQVNGWIRASREIDGYLDFDHALSDPTQPNRIDPNLTEDHLHPNSSGHRVLSDAVDLSLFE